MTLTPGSRLGPYEVLSALGAGGMGEVYRARDTRLGRDVAIKVLPAALSTNPETRARFEREARSVSSLNHPHICTLHDVGREGDVDYLVMELIEGETLTDRLARGPLPLADVLKLGAQVADALDRAHRAGVIHRDLKPGNVMITKAGAKLMDFGLARPAAAPGAPGSGAVTFTQSPTMAGPLTAEGMIVGTFQYMAPEQLEGQEADARSDVWSLGCVLYEMVTGRRAFEGKSQASLITAIMGSEPAPVSQVAPLTPPALDRLIRTCLNKDPDERVRTAHDVKLQLLGIAEGGSQAGVASPLGATGKTRRGAARLPWALAAVATLVAAVFAFLLVGRPAGPKHAVQLALLPPPGGFFSPYSATFAVSPDGRAIAYTAPDSTGRAALWMHSLEATGPARLAATQGLSVIFWSTDSRTIGYLPLGPGLLQTIPAAGGTPTTICEVTGPRGGTMNRDGIIVFAQQPSSPLFRVPASGGSPVQATWLDSTRGEASHRFPYFLPDGKHFLYAALPGTPEGIDTYVGSLDSRTVKKVLTAGSAAIYAAPGYLVFRRLNKSMAQRFDAGRLELEGEPFALADIGPPTDLDREPVASASQNGRLVLLAGGEEATRVGWFDRSGVLRSTLDLPVGRWGVPRISPDGRSAAIDNGNDLWRVDLARSVAVRLTANDVASSEPVWSPDGSRLAYTAPRTGREELLVMNADGSGEATVLPATGDLFQSTTDWARDGLMMTSIGRSTFRDLWIARTPGNGAPEPFLRTNFSEFGARVSPDGRWIAYLSNEGGVADVYIQSFPVPGHKLRVTSEGVLNNVWWMPGSDALCYTTFDRKMMTVKLARRGEELEAGTPQLLFVIPAGYGPSDMSPDGTRFLASYVEPGANDRTLRVILDWTALLGSAAGR